MKYKTFVICNSIPTCEQVTYHISTDGPHCSLAKKLTQGSTRVESSYTTTFKKVQNGKQKFGPSMTIAWLLHERIWQMNNGTMIEIETFPTSKRVAVCSKFHDFSMAFVEITDLLPRGQLICQSLEVYYVLSSGSQLLWQSLRYLTCYQVVGYYMLSCIWDDNHLDLLLGQKTARTRTPEELTEPFTGTFLKQFTLKVPHPEGIVHLCGVDEYSWK